MSSTDPLGPPAVGRSGVDGLPVRWHGTSL